MTRIHMAAFEPLPFFPCHRARKRSRSAASPSPFKVLILQQPACEFSTSSPVSFSTSLHTACFPEVFLTEATTAVHPLLFSRATFIYTRVRPSRLPRAYLSCVTRTDKRERPKDISKPFREDRFVHINPFRALKTLPVRQNVRTVACREIVRIHLNTYTSYSQTLR